MKGNETKASIWNNADIYGVAHLLAIGIVLWKKVMQKVNQTIADKKARD